MKDQAQQAAYEAAKEGPGLPPDLSTYEGKVAVFTLKGKKKSQDSYMPCK